MIGLSCVGKDLVIGDTTSMEYYISPCASKRRKLFLHKKKGPETEAGEEGEVEGTPANIQQSTSQFVFII